MEYDCRYFASDTGRAAEANQKGTGGQHSKIIELNSRVMLCTVPHQSLVCSVRCRQSSSALCTVHQGLMWDCHGPTPVLIWSHLRKLAPQIV